MARGTTWLLLGAALALGVSGGEVSATRLDKTACADLNTELSGLLASGLKEDMDKGPTWGAANLSPERLATINRVIELQGVLEFRCGSPPRNIAKPSTKPDDKSPAEKSGASKAVTAKPNADDNDEATPAKPQQKTKTMRRRRGSGANPEPPAVTPAATQPNAPPTAPAVTTARAAPETPAVTKPPPGPEKTAAASPPAAPLASEGGKVTPVSTAPKSPAAAPELNKAAAAAPIAAPAQASTTPTGAQKTAKKKPSRRDSTSAYVSPSDVNTYGLSTGR